MSEEIIKRDHRDNLIYSKNSEGYEVWYGYDERNNLIHYKNSEGGEFWEEFDEKDNVIHYKDGDGIEHWYRYEGHLRIDITQQKLKERELKEQEQEFLRREEVSRFRLMEI